MAYKPPTPPNPLEYPKSELIASSALQRLALFSTFLNYPPHICLNVNITHVKTVNTYYQMLKNKLGMSCAKLRLAYASYLPANELLLLPQAGNKS